jgi:type I restriction enzyme M protein
MLDDVTKKRINTLRQILVGKLPDPKAQVEQITNGLIYKFMNDMDEESISMGGKSTYFSGKYQKYSWKNLLDTKTSGTEKLSLYSEAIEQMYNNENLPELFREIFKNSFLPFKDPSTLNMFLKEINEFHYSHSEKLGDAFEYLLSFMGSQGDAGQFRTPRHIIDFIVEIVNPQKNETILDPACGTAGFLISSYKHILKQNTKKNLGDGLTTSDRKKIGENLNGYDISPDMVKMSLVNMYLHKFTNPKINEYDTLSSEDRWNEYYDVILANPPFFSPKGGIMPHNRFGVKSTKAEVLFTDYINEHLKPNGRAGIIIPEGIIFQSGTGYKQLRKRLVETSLIAVISLPSGIFQPYSGVKTSILILDKKLNKRLETISFFELMNDGFSLGSQRNQIEGSEILSIIKRFNTFIKNENNEVRIIQKKKIIESQNYNLSFNSYQINENLITKYETKTIKEICQIRTGKKDVNSGNPNGTYPFFTCAKENTFSDEYSFDTEALLIAGNGDVGKVKYYKGKFEAYQRTYVLDNFEKINPRYLLHILLNKLPIKLNLLKQGNTIPYIKLGMIETFEIPYPPLNIQNQIVEELDGYQKIIDGCRQIIENYKPSIDIDPNWEMVELGKIFENNTTNIKPENMDTKKNKVLGLEHIEKNSGKLNVNNDTFLEDVKSNKIIFEKGDILYGKLRPNLNKVFLADFKGYCSTDFIVLRAKEKINHLFYSSYFLSETFNSSVLNTVSGAQLPRTKYELIKKIRIPNPKLSLQNDIGDLLYEEKKLVNNNSNLILNFEKKITDKINSIWSN